MATHLLLLIVALFPPPSFSVSRFTSKVTAESKKQTIANSFISSAIQATAEFGGISKGEAAKQVQGLLHSETGLNEANELFAPIGVCTTSPQAQFSSRRRPSSPRTCSIQQFVPAGPAGFPSGGTSVPFPFKPRPPHPGCEGFLTSCTDVCKVCHPCNKFRSIDGTCNNLGTSLVSSSSTCPTNWGSTNKALRRLTANRYQDSHSVPTGGWPVPTTLPTARAVSNHVHASAAPPVGQHTMLLMQLGQFLDHDISFTPETEIPKGCCRRDGGFPSSPHSSNCFPMQISPSDPDFPSSLTCRDLSRSAPKCSTSLVSEQFNAITAYLDSSQVYGSDEPLSNDLRTHVGGRLKATIVSGEEYLPMISPCPVYGGSPLGKQFQAGDRRVTENPGLQSLHTVFLREHNRLADEIAALPNGWNDERIHQEARRLVIAQWQNVVYGEWLPEVLGPDTPSHGTNTAYSPTEDATIANVFATAAFRFGHSLIRGEVDMNPGGSYELTENFGDISLVYPGGEMDSILKGNTGQEMSKSDKAIHDSVRNELFKNLAPAFLPHGTDLAARNIQRGRDHGLGTYKDYRETVCGLAMPTGSKWTDLASFYGGYNKIEIFPGGMLETPLPDQLVGPTFSCLLARQFESLKKGDRFFFTHQKTSCCQSNCQRFTLSQQTQLKARTLRDILCENTGISHLQGNVLKPVHPTDNPLEPCTSIHPLNVTTLTTPNYCWSAVCKKGLVELQTVKPVELDPICRKRPWMCRQPGPVYPVKQLF